MQSDIHNRQTENDSWSYIDLSSSERINDTFSRLHTIPECDGHDGWTGRIISRVASDNVPMPTCERKTSDFRQLKSLHL